MLVAINATKRGRASGGVAIHAIIPRIFMSSGINGEKFIVIIKRGGAPGIRGMALCTILAKAQCCMAWRSTLVIA